MSLFTSEPPPLVVFLFKYDVALRDHSISTWTRKGRRGSVETRKFMLGHVTKGRYLSCKMSTIVHSKGGKGVKIG